MTTAATTVAPLRDRADLRAAAELHARALPTGLFPSLGARFLAAWLATFATGPHGVAFVARVDGEFAGFLVGTRDNDAHYRWALRRRGPSLALRMVGALLRRPRVLARFVRTRMPRYARAALRLLAPSRSGAAAPPSSGARRDASPAAAAPTGPIAVLTHVAVEETQRGHGVGATLTRAMLEAAAENGAREVRLVTTTAPDFYTAQGWSEHPRADDVREFRIDPTRRAA